MNRKRPLTAERLDELVKTCRQIIASSQVLQFVVGITTDPTARRRAYARWAKTHKAGPGTLDGWVILEWELTAEEAIRAERHLFNALVDHPDYGTIKTHYHKSVYRHGRNRDKQVVYLAWWSPYLVIAEEFE